MILTGDPEKDADYRDVELEMKLAQNPICCECGEYVNDDSYYDIEGNVYCPDCIDNHRHWL